MLEDEKAFRTCHFAIGENYDGDAPSLIHFDGVVKEPSIVIKYEDGTEFAVLKNGELQIQDFILTLETWLRTDAKEILLSCLRCA